MQSKSSIFILIVVILLVVGGLVYFFVLKKDGADIARTTPPVGTSGLVSTNTGRTTGTTVATTGSVNTGDQVVSLLRSLSTIQLSDAVFQNPTFELLSDISITLPPVVNQGRRNPFAPISGDNTSIIPAGSATGTVPAAPVAF